MFAPFVPLKAVHVMTLRRVAALQSRDSRIINAWSNYDFGKQEVIRT
jgi:hypothetical protein